MRKTLHLLPLILLIVATISVFYFNLDSYLSFSALQTHRQLLLEWTQQHYLLVVLAFMGIYIITVTLSIPGAAFLTLTAGFLFSAWGTVYVVISATIGATIVFWIVKFALKDWFAQKASRWVSKMQHGFQSNAFHYLFVIRLIPIFPFWVINIVPALLNVKTSIYIPATFLGIIPGSFVYIMLGNGLGHIFDTGQTPNLNLIFEPQILLPLLGLAALSLLPLVYNHFKEKKHEQKHSL